VDQIAVYILILIGVLTFGGFLYNRNVAADRFRETRAAQSTSSLSHGGALWHSQANYHGYFTAWMIALVSLPTFFVGLSFRNGTVAYDIGLLVVIIALVLGIIFFVSRRIDPKFKARTWVERFIQGLLITLSVIAVLTTLGIILSLLFESLRFFSKVPFLEFLFGLQWSPQTALRADQAGQSGSFGAVPIFAGTFLIMLVAMVIAGPIGLMIAIYTSEYASKKTRKIVKPAIEILAGIPTVVYGFFALLTVGPTIRSFAESLGFSVPTQSALAAGVVMGVMIIPLISSLSDDVINAVPQTMRDGSYALGATKSETMKQVVFAGALPGIIGAFLLAISRAIGETMIVVMAAGRAANLTGNPFEAVTTVTVQIVALLTGDQEFDSPKTLAAFALGLVLFIITLVLNMIALSVVRRYRERYV
jgi:phosphate transport system permease protein